MKNQIKSKIKALLKEIPVGKLTLSSSLDAGGGLSIEDTRNEIIRVSHGCFSNEITDKQRNALAELIVLLVNTETEV